MTLFHHIFPFPLAAFRNWMNSIGVSPYVNNLYRDLCSGLVLLQVFVSVAGCLGLVVVIVVVVLGFLNLDIFLKGFMFYLLLI